MKILVPVDFTDITEKGFKYALSLPFANEIILFHAVDDIKKSKEAQQQLSNITNKYSIPAHLTVQGKVKQGNIFETLGDVSKEVNADLIVMATHGIKGIQHFLGSHAMKLITHSKTPFIVVQQKDYSPLKKMLVPVDFTKEVKQELPAVIQYAQLFNASVLLLKQNNHDPYIQKRSDLNTGYFEDELDNAKIKYELIEQTFSLDDKYEVITKQAAAHNADIIVTTIEPDLDVADYVIGVEEQKIVANDLQLPVLCVNIRHFTIAGDQFSVTVQQ